MNRSKKGKNRKLFKKKSHSNNRLGCIIAIIVLIPILFGVYLYCQQINTQNNNEPQTDISLQIPLGKDLETPIPLVPRQEQIIRHSGYTVSYNKDLKIPNWVSYELTREETKGKEKRGRNCAGAQADTQFCRDRRACRRGRQGSWRICSQMPRI